MKREYDLREPPYLPRDRLGIYLIGSNESRWLAFQVSKTKNDRHVVSSLKQKIRAKTRWIRWVNHSRRIVGYMGPPGIGDVKAAIQSDPPHAHF